MGGTASLTDLSNTASASPPSPTTTPPAPAPQSPAPDAGTTPMNPEAAAASASPQPNQVNVTPDGQVTQPNIMQRAYHGILAALGGSNDVTLTRDPDTGKMVATTVAKTPGSQWKQIIGGALTGLAATANAGTGPGSTARALALGTGAGIQSGQQQQQQKVQQANEDYDEQQKALVRKASLQQMAVQTANASFSLERTKREAADFDAKQLNDHMAWLRDNGGTDIGTFKDFAAVSEYAKNDPTLAADIAHGRVAVTPAIATVQGKDGQSTQQVTGIQVARVPENWGNELNDKPLPIQRMVPGVDGKPPTWVTETIPAGTIKNNDYNAAVLAQVTAQTKLAGDKAENDLRAEQVKTQATERAKNLAAANESNSAAAKTRAETEQLNNASSDGEIQANAKQLVDGTMDPANLSKRSKTYDSTLAAANAYSLRTTGKPFDAAKAAGDYKFATNQNTYNTLNFLNSLTGRDNQSGNLGTVVAMSQKLGQSQFPPLNDVEQWAKLSAGNPQIAAYRAALTETSDQIAKILQGGGSGSGTSDAKLKQAGDLLNRNFNASQITATADTLRTLLANRKEEVIGDNRYLQKWHGAPAPAGMVTVQIPGQPAGQIPQSALDQFRRDHPNATVSQ